MMRKPLSVPLWPLMCAATGLYLLAMSCVPRVVLGDAAYDDALFVKLAGHILSGRWLGPYDELTLSKGPFFPIWIAACAWMKLPLALSQAALYALAGWLFVAVMKPRVERSWLLLLVFVAFLFNPLAFNLENLRVVREGLYAPLTVLVLALAAWWLASQRRPGPRPWLWAGALGAALAACWMTREECVELVLALAILAAAALIDASRRKAALARPLLLAAAAAGTAFACVGAVRWLNHRAYGVWDLVDRKQGEFRAAYGALSRVLPEPRQRHVPVSRESLARSAQESPAFRRLLPLFDPAWALPGCAMERMDSCDGELRSAWLIFALREAASRAGFYGSADAARGCYRRIADEVNAACADGRLSCLPPRATWVPPWRASYAAQTARSLGRAVYSLVFLPTLDIRPGYSGDGRDYDLFRRLIRGPFFPLKDRWTLQGEAVMDALLDAHVEFVSGERKPYVVLQQAVGPLDRKRSRILFTLCSDCWDASCALVLKGRQGTLARIPAPELLRGRGFRSGGIKVIAREARKQDMSAGRDPRRTERFFGLLRTVGNLYRLLVPAALLLASACYARSLRDSVRRRSFDFPTAVSTALLAAVCARLLLFAFIDATSWPAVNLLYLGPCYPLLILFCGTALCSRYGQMAPAGRVSLAAGRDAFLCGG